MKTYEVVWMVPNHEEGHSVAYSARVEAESIAEAAVETTKSLKESNIKGEIVSIEYLDDFLKALYPESEGE